MRARKIVLIFFSPWGRRPWRLVSACCLFTEQSKLCKYFCCKIGAVALCIFGMMSKYRNKYRNESTRFQKWNYGWNGYYFITIVTKSRVKYFGEIRRGKMYSSHVGDLAREFLCEIPKHFSFARIDSWVVMPDHLNQK